MKFWTIALGSYLILAGLTAAINLDFRYDEIIKGVLAIVAGVLVIAKK